MSWPGSQRLGALSTGALRLFPPRPQRAPPVGSQEVFRQEPEPVCRVGGGGFSGAEFAPFPSPCLLPPAGMGRLFSGVSQSLVLRTAGGVFRPVNFSLALPQFKKSPSDCSQGLLAGPHPKECRRLLSVPPPLAGGGCGRLGVLFCWELLLARNLWALFNFSSQLGGKTSLRPASARVSWWLETSSTGTPFPGRVSVPSSLVSLFNL